MIKTNPIIWLNIALQANNPQTANTIISTIKALHTAINDHGYFGPLFEWYGRKDWDYQARQGNLKALQWLDRVEAAKARGSKRWQNVIIKPATKDAMNWAAMNGHLDIVKWLHKNRTEGCTRYAMDTAAQAGHLDVVKWLHNNRTEGCTTYAMDRAAYNGHLDIVIWLHKNRTEGCTTYAMNYAAMNGHLDVIIWLHNNRTEVCSKWAMEWAMEWAASRGHQHIVAWLQEHS